MWRISIKTLVADRGKLLAALVGVVFATVLVNVQGGLFIGLVQKAGLLVEQADADIWVGHKKMHNVDFPHDVPRSWVSRIRSTPGVARAEPYLVGHSVMTLPDGGFEPVLMVGCDPASLLGNAMTVVEGKATDIRKPNGIIVDVDDVDKIGYPGVGDLREIGGRRAQVVARSKGILGFLVTPYVFTTLDRAASYLNKRTDRCSYFLVQVQPGVDPSEVCRLIRDRLPDVEAFTKKEYRYLSIEYWLKRTGLGISFGAATLLGLLVGLVIVSQTLYASVLDRLTEFGTLKAIGADDAQIYRIVFSQSTMLAFVGAGIGLGVVQLTVAVASTPRASIVVPWWLSAGSAVVVLCICLLSSLLPYTRIRRIDPAMVLQS